MCCPVASKSVASSSSNGQARCDRGVLALLLCGGFYARAACRRVPLCLSVRVGQDLTGTVTHWYFCAAFRRRACGSGTGDARRAGGYTVGHAGAVVGVVGGAITVRVGASTKHALAFASRTVLGGGTRCASKLRSCSLRPGAAGSGLACRSTRRPRAGAVSCGAARAG